jgi:hypothetical protein
MGAANGSQRKGSGGEKYAAGTLAIAVADSHNAKIGKAATTYTEQRSCPTSCVFFNGGGCYAENGNVGQYVTAPLNRAAAKVKTTPEQIARYEALQIDGMKVVAGRPLRLHTVGDCKTDKAAAIVAAAAVRYVARGGGPAWTYTHAWREVRRESWGDVHVFASCERPADVADAEARGYVAAIVVEEFASIKPHEHDGLLIQPCPAQTTKGVTCASCRLCMKTPHLREKGLTIAFASHGTALAKRRARLALTDPNNPDRKKSSRVLIPRFINNFVAQHKRDPSNTEIAKALQMSPSSVSQMRGKLATEAAELAAEAAS